MRQQSVRPGRLPCSVAEECVMAGGGGVHEWRRAVLVILCAVDVLGQVTHVDPVGYTSREGTVCYDNGRPQVVLSFVCCCRLCISQTRDKVARVLNLLKPSGYFMCHQI
jgi:hypothetical protein